jgi:hypothetical protein
VLCAFPVLRERHKVQSQTREVYFYSNGGNMNLTIARRNTHPMIVSATLRREFARELWQARVIRCTYTPDEWSVFVFGMQSGFWAVQKLIAKDMA